MVCYLTTDNIWYWNSTNKVYINYDHPDLATWDNKFWFFWRTVGDNLFSIFGLSISAKRVWVNHISSDYHILRPWFISFYLLPAFFCKHNWSSKIWYSSLYSEPFTRRPIHSTIYRTNGPSQFPRQKDRVNENGANLLNERLQFGSAGSLTLINQVMPPADEVI